VVLKGFWCCKKHVRKIGRGIKNDMGEWKCWREFVKDCKRKISNLSLGSAAGIIT
jgi:hypothetical protein